MYIAPAYDHLINSTKIKFHDNFDTIFASMLNNQLIVLIAELAVFLISMVVITYTVHQYFRKNKENLKIIIEFSHEELQKIIFYSKRLNVFFSNFSSENQILG
jgi:hypothetical protein